MKPERHGRVRCSAWLGMRECGHCHHEKPVADFAPKRAKCRTCMALIQKLFRATGTYIQARNAYQRKYMAARRNQDPDGEHGAVLKKLNEPEFLIVSHPRVVSLSKKSKADFLVLEKVCGYAPSPLDELLWKEERELAEVLAAEELAAEPHAPALTWMMDFLRTHPAVTNFFDPERVRRELMPNDPSSATRPTRASDCNREAMAGFAAAHG